MGIDTVIAFWSSRLAFAGTITVFSLAGWVAVAEMVDQWLMCEGFRLRDTNAYRTQRNWVWRLALVLGAAMGVGLCVAIGAMCGAV